MLNDNLNALKYQNIFTFSVLNKMFIIIALIHQMLIRIANKEEPDQTVSSEAV